MYLTGIFHAFPLLNPMPLLARNEKNTIKENDERREDRQKNSWSIPEIISMY
jgi:hypothetical protein